MSTVAHRRASLPAALVAVLMSLAAFVLLSAHADAAPGASITVNTAGILHDGQTISVSGNAGGTNAPDLYVAVCESSPTASNCDQSLAGIGTSSAHILVVSPNAATGAWGPVNFHVRSPIVTGHTPGGFDCTTAGTCVIGTTNSLNPADHTYDATALLDFGVTAPTTTPATTVPASTTTSTTPSTSPGKATLTLSDNTLRAGQKITVTGAHFPASPTTLYVSICKNPPSATDCDVTIGDFAVVQYDGSGAFSTSLTVHTSFLSGDGRIDCAGTKCVVGTTNGLNPLDHSYNTTTAFTVGSAHPTSPATSTAGSSSAAGSGGAMDPSSSAAVAGEGLANTGAHDVPMLVGIALGLLALGLILALAGSPQRRRH
ncbi:MAG: neocarzinostatin apoprotein domain-containing protein [Jatrophihabitantaceae bacterium]